MEPADADGGGGAAELVAAPAPAPALLPPAMEGEEKLKLPKAPAVEASPNGEASRFMVLGKFEAVGDAKVSMSSSSSSSVRRCMGPPTPPPPVFVCWNGLVPGKLLSAIAGPWLDVECCWARSDSARCDSRRRWK